MVEDALAVVEAAYRIEQSETDWLAGVLEAARGSLDLGVGLIGYFVDVSAPLAFRAWGVRTVGRDEDAERASFHTWTTTTPSPVQRHVHLFQPCGFASAVPPLGVAPADFERTREATGFPDVYGVSALDATGRGCAIAAPEAPGHTRPRPSTVLWERLAAHMATGARLRRRIEAADPPPVEAVLDPDGRLRHAEGDAQSPAGREALRDAARRIDKARSRKGRSDALQATTLWEALVARRWSLVDRFERDGRHYIVARPNEPQVERSSQLTAREAQVVAAAALGHSNKMIAYELSVSTSTVANCLASAQRKLGVSSRVELITAAARARR